MSSLAAEPDGWFWHPAQSQDDHGHQPAWHAGPCPAEAWQAGPQDPYVPSLIHPLPSSTPFPHPPSSLSPHPPPSPTFLTHPPTSLTHPLTFLIHPPFLFVETLPLSLLTTLLFCVFSYFADIELPNEQARMDILKIHSGPITKHGEMG